MSYRLVTSIIRPTLPSQLTVLHLDCGHRLQVSELALTLSHDLKHWDCPQCAESLDAAAADLRKNRERITRLEANPRLTHVRVEGDQTKTLCGLDVNVGARLQTYSYRHLAIGYTLDKDLVATKREGRYFTDIDRADAIRDGIETLPEPLCSACVEQFLASETVRHDIRNVDGREDVL